MRLGKERPQCPYCDCIIDDDDDLISLGVYDPDAGDINVECPGCKKTYELTINRRQYYDSWPIEQQSDCPPMTTREEKTL